MSFEILCEADLLAIENFFVKNSQAAIQQQPTWADVQASLGIEVLRVGMKDTTGVLINYAQLFIRRLPLGLIYLTCPRGPILQVTDDSGQATEFLNWIEQLARERGAVFVHFDWPEGSKQQTANSKQFREVGESNFPQTTLLLDLTKSEEEILAQMKPKGRYNIRVAEKHGVQVRETTDLTAAEIFHQLLTKTTARDGFAGHSVDYYKNFLQVLGPKKLGSCFLAEKDGQPVAAILNTFCGETAIYYYGASDHEHRQMMAPYALQWAAIQAAKKRGFKKYDFLGIAPEDSVGHHLAGVTDFKRKFGGEVVNYPASSELILRPLIYSGIRLIRKIRS